jgi:hypothetical protein
MALTRPRVNQIVSASVEFADPLIRLNKDQTGANNKDTGIVFERGSDTNTALIWDESADQFALINTNDTGTTSGNVSISSYAGLRLGPLVTAGLSYPTSDGTNGQVLSTNGSGTLSFISVTATPGGSTTQIQYNNAGSLAGSANLTFNGTALTMASAVVSNLTSGRVVYASTNGALVDSASLTFNAATSTLTSTNFNGQATTAKYADLAENYLADCLYPVGTVLMVGGEQEVTIAVKDSLPVIGTVSENPGYLMNSELCGNYVTPVAYIGRVPCRVIGDVNRGDRLSPSNIPGVAQATSSAGFGQSIGIALENYNDTIEGLIEILVGR